MKINETQKSNVKKRPISRNFWKILNFLPAKLRAEFIRRMFKVDYDLPDELVLKQAETEDEISQALRLVHDAYVDLNYMDPNEAKMRFTKHHLLPTTVILVVKWKDDVIGTLSIIPDSGIGLPSEQTWNLDKYKSSGQKISEISCLSIKSDFRMRRGKILLPLCKLMYLYCTDILKLDGIVVSTSIEVEPFYTDILLFEKVVSKTGQKNLLVKGNPSTCCYLPLNPKTVEQYKNVYNKRTEERNLYKFFVTTNTKQIIIPDFKRCLQAYMNKQNSAQFELIKQFPAFTENLSEHDKLVISNLFINDTLSFNIIENDPTKMKRPRYQIHQKAFIMHPKHKQPLECTLADISKNGLRLVLESEMHKMSTLEDIIIFFSIDEMFVHFKMKIRWVAKKRVLGCEISSDNNEWTQFKELVMSEVNLGKENIYFLNKKVS